MVEILLALILVVLILIFLQGNRIGDEFGKKINKIVYKRRTRKVE